MCVNKSIYLVLECMFVYVYADGCYGKQMSFCVCYVTELHVIVCVDVFYLDIFTVRLFTSIISDQLIYFLLSIRNCVNLFT